MGVAPIRPQAVARECGARLLENSDWQGFGIQKNRALDLASHEWILLLDSDEWLEASAVQEIRDVVVSSGNANLNDSRNAAAGSVPQATTGPQAYSLRRRSRYLGRIVRYSGWWPDHVTRLFRRNAARYSEDWVHERLMLFEPHRLGTLKAIIEHDAVM